MSGTSDDIRADDIGARPGGTRPCDHPGCAAGAEHRAPRSRDRLQDYLWFCLEHIRLYNSGWDYYHGMSEAEIEAHRRADVTWRRPTWPLGAAGPKSAGPGAAGPGAAGLGAAGRHAADAGSLGMRDPFGLFEHDSPGPRAEAQEAERRRARDHERGHGRGQPARRGGEAMRALAVLDLSPPVTPEMVKSRYKILVKALHPDANGGDKRAEERLKLINQAYATLKSAASSIG